MRAVRAVMACAVLLSVVWAGSASADAAARQGYVVVFERGVGDVEASARQLVAAHGGRLGFVYEHALKGFSAQLSPAAAAAIARNPQVAYVEADQLVTLSAQEKPTGIRRIFADGNANLDIDSTDDWRVDVDVAVIDTGVDYEHPDLNVVGGVNCSGGSPFKSSCTSGGDDDHYHGTHVAGTIGALDNGIGVVGVAPGARIWTVKVLSSNGSGYMSWIIAGVDWVTSRASTIEVANMSLGGSKYQALNDAVNNSANAGVAYAVAAGNSDADAKDYSPASAEKAMAVSALADFNGLAGGGGATTCRNDQDDTLADFSNWGSTVDITAPGVCILSTYPIEQGEYGTISGTSMASPHVAGALAILASKNNPANATDVGNLYASVKNAGNSNWVDDSGDGTKEPLLDLSNTTLFAPVLVAGSGDGGGGGDSTAPAAPTGLSATGGDASVGLDWSDNSESDLAGYNVYRSTTSGSGYAKVNSNLVGSSAYTDSTVSNGTTYYYVVTAVDTSGNESSRSSEASAMPEGTDGGGTSPLTGSSSNQGSTWTATVTFTGSLNDSTSGTWDFGGSMDGCTIQNGTSCSFSLSGIPKKTGSVTYTDTSIGSVTINKP